MGEPVWKRINVVGPRAVNGLNVAVYGQPGPEKSWTVPSLITVFTNALDCKNYSLARLVTTQSL